MIYLSYRGPKRRWPKTFGQLGLGTFSVWDKTWLSYKRCRWVIPLGAHMLKLRRLLATKTSGDIPTKRLWRK